MSTESAQGNGADGERMVPMDSAKKTRQLEKENRLLQEEITIYKTYFRVCAESETDPQKKDSTSDWRMQRTWNPSQKMP